MANDSTRVPDATGAAAAGDHLDDIFADTREKMRALVRGAMAVLRNQELERGAGIRSNSVGIDHGTVRILLMNLLGVPDTSAPAFDSRLKHTLRQGVVPDDRPRDDKGPRGHRRYLLIDVLQLALVFQLQRALVDPAAAAAFVIDNRDELERRWTEASRAIHQCWLEIEVDANAALGSEGKGRPSGRVGALAFPGTRQRRGISEPPLALRVDLLSLHDRVSSSMTILDQAARLVRERFPKLSTTDALRQHLEEGQ